MALLRFNNGRPEQTIDADTAADLWAVLNGEVEGTAEQRKFCENVRQLVMSWRDAPDSYIKARFDIIVPMVMASWMVKGWKGGDNKLYSKGEITRPEPSDKEGWAFGEKWGLLKDGKLTDLGRKYARQQETRYWSDINNEEKNQ